MLVGDGNPFALPCLPAGFLYARDLAFVCQLSETDTADAEFAKIGVGSATDLASVICSSGEFGCLLLFIDHGLFSHLQNLLLTWQTERPSEPAAHEPLRLYWRL